MVWKVGTKRITLAQRVFSFFSSGLLSSLESSDTTIYEPYIRAVLAEGVIGRGNVDGGRQAKERRAAPHAPPRTVHGHMTPAARAEATQGQIDGSFNQPLYRCHQNRVASAGD